MPEKITDDMVERAAEALCESLNGEDSWPPNYEATEPDREQDHTTGERPSNA